MWQPNRAQWFVIWVTFAFALLFWVWPDEAEWLLEGFGSFRMSNRTYESFRVFAVIAGVLGLWWLQGQRTDTRS
jgi:hypothetical protein